MSAGIQKEIKEAKLKEGKQANTDFNKIKDRYINPRNYFILGWQYMPKNVFDWKDGTPSIWSRDKELRMLSQGRAWGQLHKLKLELESKAAS
jgi:hypothetical protein